MIIATDLDGTLLDDAKEVGLQEQEWLKSFLHKGNILAFLTSRNIQDVKKCIPWVFNYDGGKRYIGFDEGARILLPDNRIVYMPEISVEQLSTMISAFNDLIDGFTAFDQSGHYDVVLSPKKLAMLKIKGLLKGERTNRYYILKKFIKTIKKTNKQFWKIRLALKNKEVMPAFGYLRQLLPDCCVTLNEGSVEIMHSGSGKLGALKEICSRENIPVSEVLFFGDEGNDYYCMEVTNSYAMGNAPDWIKAVAKHTTETNNRQGVFIILKTLNG